MSELLRCRDYRGREIILIDQRWQDHVLVQHPELDGFEWAVEQVLIEPAFVNQDAKHPERECFYGPSPLPASYAGVYVKVVVDYSGSSGVGGYDGEVVTAYLVDRPKPRERRKWVR